MKKLIALVSCVILLWSCEDKPSLQKYFVKNTESPKFIAIDLASNIIKTDKIALSETEKAALESFEKMNILAFRTDSTNTAEYKKEIKEVKTILKDESYQQLMKAGSGNDGATIYFVGNDDEHIEEFVVLAGKKENGFAVVRVLGNDMNPTHIMNMLSLLQKSQVDMEQLKPLQQLMK
jgi:nicotinic acid phosphoribosyltransferase